jgi:hypothetical protein
MTRTARWLGLALVVSASIAHLGCGAKAADQATEKTEQALGTTLWVSPAGSGTACTQAAPCGLPQAKANVQTLAPGMTSDIVVQVLDGTYALSAPLAFAPNDSGQNGHNVIWQAAANATPVWSGGTQITNWTPSALKAGVFQATVPSGFNTRQLYVNGVRMPRAGGRPPLGLTLTPTTAGFTASDARLAAYGNQSSIEFEFSGASSANARSWTDSRCPVSGIVGTVVTMAQPCWGNLTASAGMPWMGSGTGAPTTIENAFELLDEPGEWYLNRSTATLFYMPLAGQNLMSTTVVAPTLESLVTVTGTSLGAPVHNLQFVGLTFAYATWLAPGTPAGFAEMQANFTQTSSAADGRQGGCTAITPNGSCPFAAWTKTPANVLLHTTQSVSFTRDTFTHLGGAALGLEVGSSNDAIVDCTFADVSGSGIQLGGTDDPTPPDPRATVSSVTVQGNYIHDLPVEYLGGVGIFEGYTANVSIQNNVIANTSYSGMSLGWGGWARTASNPSPPSLLNASRSNIVAGNHVYNVLQSLSDGGPLYSNGNRGTAFSNGDTYTGNHFHDSNHSGHGVYDDIGSRFVTITNQVVYDVPSAWGGCAASGDMVFQGGFWLPVPVLTSDFGCNPPPTTNVTAVSDTSLSSPDPGVACEGIPACASVISGAVSHGAAPEDRRGEVALVDDQDPSFTFTGSSWVSDPARTFADIRSSLHYATANGDAFTFAFEGTGVDYIAELDSNRGDVSITVDGVAYPNVNCWGQQFVANQACSRVRGLAPGGHLFRAVKLDGGFLSVDAMRVYSDGPHGAPVDDTASAITYAGSSWGLIHRSDFGEYDSTLHAATANGDSYAVAFTGTGVELFGDKDSSRGPVDVLVDGALVQQIGVFTAAAASSQQLLFSVHGLAQGAHTVTGIKRGGTFMDLDRVDVYGTSMIDDADTSVHYVGSGWSAATGTTVGDFDNDVHTTTVDGDTATVAFTGSGIDVVTETGADRGVVDVRVDGIPRGRAFTYAPSFAPQQTVYRIDGLRHDAHTLVLTKHGAGVMAVDAFAVSQ